MNDKQEILESLAPLFKAADQNGLWFFSRYQGLWFSPDDLRKAQQKDKFVWGAVNWELRNPNEKIKELEREQKIATDNLRAFKEKL